LVNPGSVAWTSLNLSRLAPIGSRNYWRQLDRIGQSLRPDIVWACSDVPHALLGATAAQRLGAKLVIDLYDNFESYPLARVPGVTRALRRAISSAAGVSCISSPLAGLVRDEYKFKGELCVIENAIPPGQFMRRDKAECRTQFGLPPDAILIGTAGALSQTRGTECLLRAFQLLSQEDANVHLVLAGAASPELRIPSGDRVHYLGLLPANVVPNLLSTLDVSVVCNRDSAFGRYCFPQKLYESIACEIPVVVARIGAMAELLRDFPENLYEPDDAESLLVALRQMCREPKVPAIDVSTWPLLGE
jgi:teichuronic acid biosynthesis glycosyltransferase TuaC